MSLGKYNYVKRVEQTFPCGCHIDEMLDESYGITYCPIHASAPDMYEALRTTITYPQPSVVSNLTDDQCRGELTRLCQRLNRFFEIKQKALDKAEGSL
jgi:hypothetical protein